MHKLYLTVDQPVWLPLNFSEYVSRHLRSCLGAIFCHYSITIHYPWSCLFPFGIRWRPACRGAVATVRVMSTSTLRPTQQRTRAARLSRVGKQASHFFRRDSCAKARRCWREMGFGISGCTDQSLAPPVVNIVPSLPQASLCPSHATPTAAVCHLPQYSPARGLGSPMSALKVDFICLLLAVC